MKESDVPIAVQENNDQAENKTASSSSSHVSSARSSSRRLGSSGSSSRRRRSMSGSRRSSSHGSKKALSSSRHRSRNRSRSRDGIDIQKAKDYFTEDRKIHSSSRHRSRNRSRSRDGIDIQKTKGHSTEDRKIHSSSRNGSSDRSSSPQHRTTRVQAVSNHGDLIQRKIRMDKSESRSRRGLHRGRRARSPASEKSRRQNKATKPGVERVHKRVPRSKKEKNAITKNSRSAKELRKNNIHSRADAYDSRPSEESRKNGHIEPNIEVDATGLVAGTHNPSDSKPMALYAAAVDGDAGDDRIRRLEQQLQTQQRQQHKMVDQEVQKRLEAMQPRSGDEVREDNSSNRRGSFMIVLVGCLFLLAIVGGVVACLVTLTVNVSTGGSIISIPEGQKYAPPSDVDCLSIANSGKVDAQDTMNSMPIHLGFDIELFEETANSGFWLGSFMFAIREKLVPILVGCNDGVGSRRLLPAIDDYMVDVSWSRGMLESFSIRFVIANVFASGMHESNEDCQDGTTEPCYRAGVKLEVVLKGMEDARRVLELVADIIEEAKGSSASNRRLMEGRRLGLLSFLELPPDYYRGITLVTVTSPNTTIEETADSTSARPSLQPSVNPTSKPTFAPFPGSTPRPTIEPTIQTPLPTPLATNPPTSEPSRDPTFAPLSGPSPAPTPPPTLLPTPLPTPVPTPKPSQVATPLPSRPPTGLPTPSPTLSPTEISITGTPTRMPSRAPSGQPSQYPSLQPSQYPSHQPSESPTAEPSLSPSRQPSESPTEGTLAETEIVVNAQGENGHCYHGNDWFSGGLKSGISSPDECDALCRRNLGAPGALLGFTFAAEASSGTFNYPADTCWCHYERNMQPFNGDCGELSECWESGQATGPIEFIRNDDWYAGHVCYRYVIPGTPGLGCPGSSTRSFVPTAAGLEADGWQLVAWAQGTDGMFNGNTDLNPTASYGTPPADLVNISPSQLDFQIPYADLLTPNGNEILFITGDHRIWGYMEYESAFPLQAVVPFIDPFGPPNIEWIVCPDNDSGINRNCGHILFRGPVSEDPWISIADGDHLEGYNQNLMFWAENNYYNDGVNLKNSHGGMKVLVRAKEAPLEVDVNNVKGTCPPTS